jgi:hypothetical protein
MSFENTRIFKLINKLDAPSLNRFSKFIHSPYFNRNEKIKSLFDIIYNAVRSGNAVESKEELWIRVGFADTYKDIKFRKLCNDLVERYEKFMVVEQLEKKPLLKSNLLLESIRDFGNELIFEKHVSKANTIFDRIPDHSSDYFLQKYQYDKTLQNLKTNYEKKEDIKKYINNEQYQNLSRQLDAFYSIESLRHAIDIITWSKQYKFEIKLDLAHSIQLIENKQLGDVPAVKIYWLIYRILTDNDSKELYYELKELAAKEIYSFPHNEQAEIFDALFSYCIKWVNKGDKQFHLEYLDIHDWGIREELILKNGILSPTSFRNYVVIGLRISEFPRVESYIKQNIHLLEASRRENALNFNMARVAFYKKDFEGILSYLRQVNYDDIWYNINSKNYLLAAYYELDEIDALYSSIDSFVNFLRREKSLDNSRKKRHILFTNYLKKLINYSDNKSKLLKLKEQLVEEREIVNKNWLLEKIEELI